MNKMETNQIQKMGDEIVALMNKYEVDAVRCFQVLIEIVATNLQSWKISKEEFLEGASHIWDVKMEQKDEDRRPEG